MSDHEPSREQLLQEVQSLRERLAALGAPAAAPPDAAVCTLDATGLVTSWDAAAERLVGYTAEDVLGRHFSCLYALADIALGKPQQTLQQAGRTGRVEEEGWRMRKGGGRFWARAVLTAERDPAGQLRGFTLVTRDETDTKQTRDSLQDQSRLLQAVLATAAEGVIAADERGKFLVWNAAAEQIIGLGPEDSPLDKWAGLYGCYLPDMTTPYPTEQLPLVRALRGETVDGCEIFLRNAKRPGGVWIRVNARPLHDEHGAARGGIVVFQDITAQKRPT